MRYNVIVHMQGDEPIEGELEELPPSNASFIAIKNPRKRGNRGDLEWLDRHTNTLLLSMSQMVCVEVAPARAEQELVTKHGYDVR